MLTKRVVIAIFICLFCIYVSQAATSQPINYKDWLINMAIKDGYTTVDKYARSTFWYYLRNSSILDYQAKVNINDINYRIIYMAQGGLFLINAGLNKRHWQVSLNNIVKINADIVKYY